MMAVRIPSKFDLRRLCGPWCHTLARLGALSLRNWEVPSPLNPEIGSDRCTVFKSATDAGASSRPNCPSVAAPKTPLDDLERSIEDAVNTVRTLVTRMTVLFRGLVHEMAMSRALARFADLTPGVSQYAIRAFAESFEIVPRILAMNAGFDSYECLARLAAVQESNGPCQGLNINDAASPVDAKSAGIVDSLSAKSSAVHLAVDAALTILRVDQIIMARNPGVLNHVHPDHKMPMINTYKLNGL